MKYEFHPAAEAEHLENVGYYELKRAGLGATYLSDFEITLNKICGFPSRFPIDLKPNVCRGKMENFPFTILLFRHASQNHALLVQGFSCYTYYLT